MEHVRCMLLPAKERRPTDDLRKGAVEHTDTARREGAHRSGLGHELAASLARPHRVTHAHGFSWSVTERVMRPFHTGAAVRAAVITVEPFSEPIVTGAVDGLAPYPDFHSVTRVAAEHVASFARDALREGDVDACVVMTGHAYDARTAVFSALAGLGPDGGETRPRVTAHAASVPWAILAQSIVSSGCFVPLCPWFLGCADQALIATRHTLDAPLRGHAALALINELRVLGATFAASSTDGLGCETSSMSAFKGGRGGTRILVPAPAIREGVSAAPWLALYGCAWSDTCNDYFFDLQQCVGGCSESGDSVSPLFWTQHLLQLLPWQLQRKTAAATVILDMDGQARKSLRKRRGREMPVCIEMHLLPLH